MKSSKRTTMDPFLSDNLQAWRLETRREANGDRCHRSMFGPEYWRPLRHLGNGTFGDVWLEHCLAGPSCNALRAVKHIRKRHADFSKPSRRELEALITFSDTRVPEVCCRGRQPLQQQTTQHGS